MKASEFIDSLSAEQRNAATYTRDPLMVLAGAGSGKTRTLVGRFVYLVAKPEAGGLGADPGSVMMVTFTNKAAGEMRERIAEPLRDLRDSAMATPFGEPWIGTFHSLSLRILRIESEKAGLGKNFSIYDDSDARSLLNDVVEDMELSAFDADEFFKDLETAKARVLTPEFLLRGKSRLAAAEAIVRQVCADFKVDPETIEISQILLGRKLNSRLPDGFAQACQSTLKVRAPDARHWSSIFGLFSSENFVEIYDRYQKELEAQNAVDFNDLLNRTTKLFTQNEDVRNSWRSSFRHFMVDEVQDMNRAQVLWLMALTGGGEIMEVPEDQNRPVHNDYADATHGQHEINSYRLRFFPKPTICFVGDDDQAIYGFRGSESAVLRGLEQRFTGLQTRYLLTSYRCQPAILEAANALVGKNELRFGKDLYAHEGARRGAPVAITHPEEPSKELAAIYEEVQAYVAAGNDPREFAILTRTRDIAKHIAKEMRAQGLPVIEGKSSDLRKTAEIRDVMSFVAALTNPDAEVPIMRIINKPARGLGPTSIRKVRNNARLKGINTIQELNNIISGRIEIPDGGDGYAERFISGVKQFEFMIRNAEQKAMTAGTADKGIEVMLRLTGYLPDLYHGALKAAGVTAASDEQMQLSPRAFLTWLITTTSAQKQAKQGRQMIDLEKCDAEDLADRAGALSEVARRIGNIAILLEEAAAHSSLLKFAQESTLEMGRASAPASGVQILTMHGAKGLEFDHVRIPFCLDGVIPHQRALDEGEEALEEERRLFYVALTRGKKTVGVSAPQTTGSVPYLRVRQAEASGFLEDMKSNGADVHEHRPAPVFRDRGPTNSFFSVNRSPAAKAAAAPAPVAQPAVKEFLFQQIGSGRPFALRPDDQVDQVVNTYPYGLAGRSVQEREAGLQDAEDRFRYEDRSYDPDPGYNPVPVEFYERDFSMEPVNYEDEEGRFDERSQPGFFDDPSDPGPMPDRGADADYDPYDPFVTNPDPEEGQAQPSYDPPF